MSRMTAPNVATGRVKLLTIPMDAAVGPPWRSYVPSTGVSIRTWAWKDYVRPSVQVTLTVSSWLEARPAAVTARLLILVWLVSCLRAGVLGR